MERAKKVYQHLNDNNIEFILHEHPAVYTCEDADLHCGDIPGVPCKNIFLKKKKAEEYYLVVMPATKRLDIKSLYEPLGTKKVSFAKPEHLLEVLGLEPGSVSPFGLINDDEVKTKVYIDQDLREADIVSFHPNDNRATLEISQDMFRQFLEGLDHECEVLG